MERGERRGKKRRKRERDEGFLAHEALLNISEQISRGDKERGEEGPVAGNVRLWASRRGGEKIIMTGRQQRFLGHNCSTSISKEPRHGNIKIREVKSGVSS